MDIAIRKTESDLRVPPNLPDNETFRRDFSWEAVRAELAGLEDGGLNIAFEAVDRHATGPLADRCAFRFLTRNLPPEELSWRQLAGLTNRFARVLMQLGVGKGDRLFILAGRIPELYIAALGALKKGVVVAPLFSAFGPDPIATRVNLGEGRILVTTTSLYRQKVAKHRARMPSLEYVLLVSDEPGQPVLEPGTLDLASLMAEVSDEPVAIHTGPEDMALLHYTSGTTGAPKGAVHVHNAVLSHYQSGKYALDLHPDDVYWCTADPGWVTGTSYGIIAPLLQGVTSIVDREEFDADRWYSILESEAVTVWYTAPTAIRRLMKAGPEVAQRHHYPSLRFVASVGEPLNPEGVWWGKDVLGLPIHDNWWQTETGAIMIANTPACDIKPGSMGRPLPGIQAAIMEHGKDGAIREITTPYNAGELAIKTGWPSMFRGYLNNPGRYRKSFSNGWYLTGDLAMKDEDGYYWFVGRADDVIQSAGHLIGPFEVESVLMEHPAVAEAGAIGKPDPVAGEVVKAFISLKHGHEASDSLRLQILDHARKRLGASVAPKAIEFVANLPRTRSGKIMRRLLRARELGLPEGDTSTMESI